MNQQVVWRVAFVGLFLFDLLIPFLPIGAAVLAVAAFHQPFCDWLMDRMDRTHQG